MLLPLTSALHHGKAKKSHNIAKYMHNDESSELIKVIMDTNPKQTSGLALKT